MTRIRVVFPAALLLLGGCLSVPSGIVDNFVPPQGQTVVTEVKTPICADDVTNEKGDPATVTPCTTEVVTIAAAPPPRAVPNAFDRNRPRPPRLPGRRR